MNLYYKKKTELSATLEKLCMVRGQIMQANIKAWNVMF